MLVEVRPIEEPDRWFWSDTIWIITSAKPETVDRWLGKLYQSDAPLIDGFENSGEKKQDYIVPAGMHALGVWWD